jgi:uncharacterized protein YcbK (DUF882 family)
MFARNRPQGTPNCGHDASLTYGKWRPRTLFRLLPIPRRLRSAFARWRAVAPRRRGTSRALACVTRCLQSPPIFWNARRSISSCAPEKRGVVGVPGAQVSLVNPHSGETFNGLYRDDHGPLATAMADLSVFLRDFHSGATVGIDVAVIDFLAAVMDAVDAQSAAILSAYRTPETNAMLSRTTFGVAENSQHLYGRALDIRFGSRLAEAMFAARAINAGASDGTRIPNSSISIRDRCETGSRRERARFTALRWPAFPLRWQSAIGNSTE